MTQLPAAIDALGDSNAREQALLFEMLRIRRIEEAIAARYPEQEMRTPVHLCVGQEATPVGVSEHLRQTDKVMSGHRSHGHYLAKGGDLPAMIAEIYGKVTGCSRGKGGSQHLVDLTCGFLGSAPILASTLSIGVGVAWALRQKGTDDISVVYFGDAATEEGVFHESVSFASLHKLPVVFVCENNLYSTHSQLGVRQPSRPIADLAVGHDLPGVTADGNDVFAVSATAAEAVARARCGEGPSLLVFDTYRWLEHVGPFSDVNLGYRTAAELEQWMATDPIRRVCEYLSSRDPNWTVCESRMEALVDEEIADAFLFARSSPFPDISEMMMGVYPEKSGRP